MCKEKKSCTCSCGDKKSLQESKQVKQKKVSISSEQKEILKQHKFIQESLLSIYQTCSDKGIFNEKLLDILDESYKKIDEGILLLLTEDIKK